ncbi:unnamed protein product [Parnassius apollo]|uniref:(apollo) hypothetical protein n=1 Tax=Parnassius apollo TaxID=110799 RepID=A0A8S3X1S3_PARAO|nr:unnamed protein product [Parnassius apollo]
MAQHPLNDVEINRILSIGEDSEDGFENNNNSIANPGMENILLPGEPILGASSNVVIRMARDTPCHQNYRLYYDNYFISLPLLEYLAKQGILSILSGTIHRNRIPDCKLPKEKEMSKKVRGYSVEYGIDVATVAWKYNEVINLASSFAGEISEDKVQRYDSKNKRYVNIDCPNIVREYNRHMRGVDLIDSIMGSLKKHRKTEAEIQTKHHKGKTQHVPTMAIRQDQVRHWPIWEEKEYVMNFQTVLACPKQFVRNVA